ncbi:MAG: hypothetical protein U9P36_02345 [Thermodesulfobacteriota bacterium]|nr:hypothetical protein [Thermodesulfobacteriota bacterium]
MQITQIDHLVMTVHKMYFNDPDGNLLEIASPIVYSAQPGTINPKP